MMVKYFLKTATVFTAAIVILFSTGVQRATAGALISGVHTDKSVLRAGETVAFGFRLALDAQIKAMIYDPDGLAVTFLFDGHKPAGNCVFTWDGRDDNGNIVPDEAYFIGIEATEPGGKTDAYHADAISGGERIDPVMDRGKKQDGTYAFSYLLQHPARVCIRAGIHAVPLMKTLVDWKPRAAGPHVINWDGKDDTGRFNVMNMKNAFVSIMAYALPENSVIVSSGNNDYRKYHLARSGQTQTPTQNGFSQTRRLFRSSSSDDIATEFLRGSISNQSPTFTVTVDGNRPENDGNVNVSGIINLKIVIDDDYIEIFNQGRYEIVVFIDAQRFDEEENGFSPYVYHLDTARFSPGAHLLTINEVGIDGQAGSYSLTLNVEN